MPETVHFDPESNRRHVSRKSMLDLQHLEALDCGTVARLICGSLAEVGVPLGALSEQDLKTGIIDPKMLLFPLTFLFVHFCEGHGKQAPVPNIILEDVPMAEETRTAAQWWETLYHTLYRVREREAACRKLVLSPCVECCACRRAAAV